MHSPSDIYVTKLDYARLLQLVHQAHPAADAEAVAALNQELARAHLVDSYDILPDVVTMNSRIKLRDLNSTDELQITLVYPPQADPARHRISILNPVAVAVLGARLGDKVKWPSPHGLVSYWVEAILHQPEAAGDWLS
ncbi:nucleoside diphosphate kinase regulator [Hymenobacter sp. BT635]|uniref:Nucleoside diphosphate kinase regulator n=1 Tax=Hymenobacter nitidus TaxID=2880929 RepID=A0ABS8A8L1_9BACT|nr:nucleoside diphosphate kinase regulator [Hymenobacter nitidus]MCB2376237.1 nucleoside diphosphate kinase regulator [Hymenobacter nitidus]